MLILLGYVTIPVTTLLPPPPPWVWLVEGRGVMGTWISAASAVLRVAWRTILRSISSHLGINSMEMY